MEKKIANRMEIPPSNRGRPAQRTYGETPGELDRDTPRPIEPVEIPQPPITGMRCLACGRGMIPRRLRQSGEGIVYACCSLCGANLALTIQGNAYTHVRLVSIRR